MDVSAMKAQIFMLRSQERLAREIGSLLRSNLYQDIDVAHTVYDEEDETEIRVGLSYLKLMRASTAAASEEVASTDFAVEVEDEEGSWGYYWDPNATYMLRLPHDMLTKVFPAVSIMGRMVMVPREIHQAFDAPSDFSYMFKPLDVQGVVLANFDQKESTRKAVQRVAAQIRREIVSLGQRHMSLQGTRSPDLEELARLLGLEEDFLRGLEQDILRPSPHLSTKITSKPGRLRSISQVTLAIQNESADAPGIVRVQVRAPAGVMNAPLVQYIDFSPGMNKQQTIKFDVRPKTAPYCPLEVLYLLEEVADDAAPPVALILDVVEK
jgi:hypothetical protein